MRVPVVLRARLDQTRVEVGPGSGESVVYFQASRSRLSCMSFCSKTFSRRLRVNERDPRPHLASRRHEKLVTFLSPLLAQLFSPR